MCRKIRKEVLGLAGTTVRIFKFKTYGKVHELDYKIRVSIACGESDVVFDSRNNDTEA